MQPEHHGTTLVNANFNGAFVMQDRKGGVSGLLLKYCPHLFPTQYIAHNLQLSVMDTIRNVPNANTFEYTMKELGMYYQG